MSDNKNTFDDLLNDLEALKAKYSQRQPAEEPKPIKKAPQPIHQQEEAAPAPLPPVEEPVAVPVHNEPAPVKKQDDDISVYEDMLNRELQDYPSRYKLYDKGYYDGMMYVLKAVKKSKELIFERINNQIKSELY